MVTNHENIMKGLESWQMENVGRNGSYMQMPVLLKSKSGKNRSHRDTSSNSYTQSCPEWNAWMYLGIGSQEGEGKGLKHWMNWYSRQLCKVPSNSESRNILKFYVMISCLGA